MPPGIGGIGEIEFIKKIKGIEGHLTLYHGTTNLLRMGDVSFINLETLRLTALGEIKTEKKNKSTLEISLILIWPKTKKPFTFLSKAKKGKALAEHLPNKIKVRLDRQIKKMSSSYRSVLKVKKTKNKEVFSETYLEDLKTLAKRLKPGKFAYQKAGNSLLMVAYKSRKTNFSSRFTNDSKENINSKLNNLQSEALQIVDPSSSGNSISIKPFHYRRDSEAHVMAGSIPLFWWPIDLNLSKEIYFQDITLIIIYNAMHFFRKLDEIGLKVEWDKKRNRKIVVKRSGKRRMEFYNFGYFLNLIQEYLFTEDAVLEIIKKSMSEFGGKKLPDRTRIDLNIFQRFEGIF